MSDVIKDFQVALGFKGDETSAKKTEDLARRVEANVTKAADEGAAKRVATEASTTGKRMSLLEAAGKIFLGMERDRVDRVTKLRKDEAAQDEKVQAERERKTRERRAAALKDIQAGATRMAAFALKTVAGVEAVALGIVYATDKAAKSMERLNYAAARSGTTPGKMTATGYAFSQLGSTAEAGEAVVAGIGDRLKTNPNGYAASLRHIGVEARKANGEMKDASDIAVDLGEALARIRKNGGQYGYANAKAWGAQFGAGPDEVQTMMDPRYRGMVTERQSIDAKIGTDQGAAAAGGTKFEQSMRRLDAVIDSIKTKVETKIFKNLQPELDKLSDWGEKHGGQVADVVGRLAADVLKLANAFLKHLSKVNWDKVVSDLEDFGKNLDKKMKDIFGDNGTTVAVLAGFSVAIASKVLGPLNLVLGAMRAIGGLALLNPTTTVAATAAAADAEMARRTGAAMTSGNLNTKYDPETGFVNDLDFGYGDKNQGADANSLYRDYDGKGGGIWNSLKRLVGLGSDDPDARKVKDAITSTAENVKKLADNGGLEQLPFNLGRMHRSRRRRGSCGTRQV